MTCGVFNMRGCAADAAADAVVGWRGDEEKNAARTLDHKHRQVANNNNNNKKKGKMLFRGGSNSVRQRRITEKNTTEESPYVRYW